MPDRLSTRQSQTAPRAGRAGRPPPGGERGKWVKARLNRLNTNDEANGQYKRKTRVAATQLGRRIRNAASRPGVPQPAGRSAAQPWFPGRARGRPNKTPRRHATPTRKVAAVHPILGREPAAETLLGGLATITNSPAWLPYLESDGAGPFSIRRGKREFRTLSASCPLRI